MFQLLETFGETKLGRLLHPFRGPLITLLALLAVLIYAYGLFPNHVPFETPEDVAALLKFGLAALALTAFAFEAFRRLSGRPVSIAAVRLAGIALAAASVFSYLNFGSLGYGRVYHRWELFHYYLGGKYHNELGYTRIYAAAAAAQLEDADQAIVRETMGRSLRDLERDEVVPVASMVDQFPTIKQRFSPERWQAFRADVHWFRTQCDPAWWAQMQTDHGFNPPPTWSILGSLVSSAAPASDGFCRLLSAIDILIFAAMFYAIWWAFGARTLVVSLVFWGTQWPADYTFTWGALLRQDWIFGLVVAACFLKKRRWAWAGAFLTCSSLLRIFPVVFFVGPVAVMAVDLWTTRRIRPSYKRFVLGAALSFSVLMGVSLVQSGPQAFVGFAHNISRHNNAPGTNMMGLPALVSFKYDQRVEATQVSGADPFTRWKALRQARAAERSWLLHLLQLASIALVVWSATRHRSMLVAMVQCALLGVTLFDNAQYYYSYFFLIPLLTSFDRRLTYFAFTASGLSAALLLWGRMANFLDIRSVAETWIFLALALIVTCWFGVHGGRKQPGLQKTDARRTRGRLLAAGLISVAFAAAIAFEGAVAPKPAEIPETTEVNQSTVKIAVGAADTVLITVIQEDIRELGCISAELFEGLRCAVANKDEKALPTARDILQPFSTLDNRHFIGAGLWDSLAQANLPKDRFVAKCTLRVIAKKTLPVRFKETQDWWAAKNWPLGELTACSVVEAPAR